MTIEPTAEQVARWLAVVASRRSRRSYDSVPAAREQLEALSALCRDFRPFPDARAVLVAQAPASVFRGIVGSYGRVTGAPHALAFLGERSSSSVNEHVGYTGEALVLEAHALGLGTCWVGGFFREGVAARAAGASAGEHVYAVTPVGHPCPEPTAAERLIYHPGRPKHRKSLEEIAPGCGSWPAWARSGLEAAQVAPSAVHRQPWRFRMDGDGVVVAFEGTERQYSISRRLDCGIAMLHFELGARAAGCEGRWSTAQGRDVGRWAPLR